MPPTDPALVVDHERIECPSDRITLGQMRKAEPHLFEAEFLRGGSAAQAEAHALYSIELRLAQDAFDSALGLPKGKSGFDREWWVEVLDEAYQLYGVSCGTYETRELVRAIEFAAASQAGRRGRRR